jgi:hypothetical protein
MLSAEYKNQTKWHPSGSIRTAAAPFFDSAATFPSHPKSRSDHIGRLMLRQLCFML